MRSGFLTVVICLCAGPAWGQQKSPAPVTAVFRIENRGSELKRAEVDALTDYLATKLGEQGRFQIIPREEIRRRLVKQKRESFKSCYDKKCQVEVGRELAAQFSVSASISKVGTQCLITSAMYDLKKAATWRTATAKAKCNADALLVAVEEIAAKLSGNAEVAKPVVPAERPTPAVTPTVTVSLSTDPGGAEVLVDGRLQGQTPIYMTFEKGQKYRVVIQKDGYKTIDKDMAFDTPARVDEKLTMTQEHIRSREVNRTEWLSWYLGLIVAGGEVGFGESLSLFTLKWDHFYWTILDTYGLFLPADDFEVMIAYATRIGFPINVGDRAQHQFRIGLGAGMCAMPGSADTGACFSPSLGYVYQTGGWYHLGVAISTFISTSSNDAFPVILSFFAPLGWTGSAD